MGELVTKSKVEISLLRKGPEGSEKMGTWTGIQLPPSCCHLDTAVVCHASSHCASLCCHQLTFPGRKQGRGGQEEKREEKETTTADKSVSRKEKLEQGNGQQN